jgi:hypothetical protein
MKTKLLFTLPVTLFLYGCDQKTSAIRPELRLIDQTVKDTSQKEFVRESAEVFAKILSEKQGATRHELMKAHWDMVLSRNETTIATYVAFLKAIEKKLPDHLPPVETYEAMKNKAGSSKILEYNLGQNVIMMSNSIQNITLYNDPQADAEVEGVLKRLKEKYISSETLEKILGFLNMVHGQALESRAGKSKPWESSRIPSKYD